MLSLCHASRRRSAGSRIFAALALLGVSSFGCKQERTAPGQVAVASVTAPATEAGPKVVFLGDSLSAGLHLSAEQAFPALLQRRFAERGLPFQLTNAGVSGDTSAGGLRRTEWLLRQRPDIVVLELGANDGLRGVPIADVEANLRAIVQKVQAQGAKVLLLGMRLPPSYGAEYSADFAAMYQRLAGELHLPHVPFFMQGVAGVASLNLEDGLHPTAEGHALLVDNVAAGLEPLLRAL